MANGTPVGLRVKGPKTPHVNNGNPGGAEVEQIPAVFEVLDPVGHCSVKSDELCLH